MLVPKHAIVFSMCALTLMKILKLGRTKVYSCIPVVKEIFQNKLLLETQPELYLSF